MVPTDVSETRLGAHIGANLRHKNCRSPSPLVLVHIADAPLVCATTLVCDTSLIRDTDANDADTPLVHAADASLTAPLSHSTSLTS